MGNEHTLQHLLLSYVALVLERNGYGPGDNGEFLLWDDLLRAKPTLVSLDEKQELVGLIIRSHSWISCNMETGMFQLIDIDAWAEVLEHRDH